MTNEIKKSKFLSRKKPPLVSGQLSLCAVLSLSQKTSDCVTLETKTSFCCSAKLVKYKQTFDMRIATNFRLILSLQCQLKPCRCGSQMWPWHKVFKFWLEKLIHARILSHRIPLNNSNIEIRNLLIINVCVKFYVGETAIKHHATFLQKSHEHVISL